MACQVPVISSNAGGIPELNINGVTGFMSDVGDVDDMAKNSLTILRTDESLKKFKSQALNRAKDFDTQVITPMYEQYYAKVIEASMALEK